MSEQHVDAGGVLTRYLDLGAGKPLLLLHGSGPGVSAAANWRLAIPEFADRFRVVAPDLLGFGGTPAPTETVFTLDRWRDHLLSFLDALNLDRVSIVGNSFGGALALSLALNHPHRVERIVTMGSVGRKFPITQALDDVWGYEPSEERMGQLLKHFLYDQDWLDDALVKQRYEETLVPGIQKSYTRMFPAPRQRWVDSLSFDERALARLPHEVLVLHGRDDAVIPVDVGVRLAEAIPKAQLHVFDRCGHWIQIEQTRRFLALTTWFLTEDES